MRDAGIYEFRITFHPTQRIFGAFTRPGEFLATNVRARAVLEAEGFGAAKQRHRSIWAAWGNLDRDRSSRAALLGDFDG